MSETLSVPGGPAPPCLDEADANDAGQVSIAEGIPILNFLFLGGPAPPAPCPDCGTRSTPDDGVTRRSFSRCA